MDNSSEGFIVRSTEMIVKTERLFLREMTPDDHQALLKVLSDPETMWHYPYTFDGQHVRDWIERNMNRYRKDGFGLYSVLPDGRIHRYAFCM